MVRAPCCEKMGLKKGPWTPEEDRILVGHIQKFGHGNWRALPKQAGLLRCGKSCRLRWTNYLRPDIKRGNFTSQEEETIISLHQMLGNRWSAIAARLPGRTDNEIKNVWHTHLKKRASPEGDPAAQDSTKRRKGNGDARDEHKQGSPDSSYSDVSSSNASKEEGEEGCIADSLRGFPEIEESFWLDALSGSLSDPFELLSSSTSVNGDEMSFWLKLFMESGDALELPDI